MLITSLRSSLLVGAALLGCGVLSMAEEPMDRATPNKSELMNDCIRKHQAGDVNLSKSELNRICKLEVKQNKTVADTPPPQDTPKN